MRECLGDERAPDAVPSSRLCHDKLAEVRVEPAVGEQSREADDLAVVDGDERHDPGRGEHLLGERRIMRQGWPALRFVEAQDSHQLLRRE